MEGRNYKKRENDMEKKTEAQGVSTPLTHREGQGEGLLNRFLKQTKFSSVEDYNKNLEFIIPENFNFAYDVMDVWAEEKPEGLAILWTNDQGEEIRTTFAELKEQTDQAASYLQSLGIGKNDPVMLILKRHYEWWVIMLALCKIGAIVIPATHMLTKHDYVYRNTRASVKAIICADDEYITGQIKLAMPESPTVKQYIAIGEVEGFHNWRKEWQEAPKFQRPAFVNDNDDTMLMYFTSGTSGEPTSPWPTPVGARPSGASSTDSGLPVQRCLSSTTRSSMPTRCCARWRNTR